MMTDAVTLDRAAGYAALLAMISLPLAGLAFILFLNGAGSLFGPVNDLLSSLTLLLLALPVIALRARVGDDVLRPFGVISLLALVGIAIAAGGLVLLVAGVIDLNASFITFGLGIVPVLVWIGALAVAAFRTDGLPDVLGWTALAFLMMVVVTAVVATVSPGPILAAACLIMLVVLETWLATIASTLLRGWEVVRAT